MFIRMMTIILNELNLINFTVKNLEKEFGQMNNINVAIDF